jgi:hypothetical protein
MKIHKFSSIALGVVLSGVLPLSGLALAEDAQPLTPELAAKREMVRKQQDQRITPEKRKAAAEALKAERLKIHQAQQDLGIAPATPQQGK